MAIGAAVGAVAGGIAAAVAGQDVVAGIYGGAAAGLAAGSGLFIAGIAAEVGGGLLGAYAAAGYSATANLLGQAVQFAFDPSRSNGAPICGGEFQPNLRAAAIAGLVGGLTLGVGSAAGAYAEQISTAAEVATEATVGWLSSSAELGANTAFGH